MVQPIEVEKILADSFDAPARVTSHRSRWGWRNAIEASISGDVWIFMAMDSSDATGAISVEQFTSHFNGMREFRELMAAISDDEIAGCELDPFGRPFRVLLHSPARQPFEFEENDFELERYEPGQLWAAGLIRRGRRVIEHDGE